MKISVKGKKIKSYLPNPGRLLELLLPGSEIYLEANEGYPAKLPYTVVAVKKGDYPVMLHTHRTNDVANFLIEKDMIPGLEGTEIVGREVKEKNSRFDFLLKKRSTEILLEVKSCTLFSRRVAMFPDAATLRGKRHVEELSDLSRKKTKGAVLFIIHMQNVDVFLPEYHTDLDFSSALYSVKDKVMIIPLAICWKEDLSLSSEVKLLDIPWKIIETEAYDRGCYLIIFRLNTLINMKVGSLGMKTFKKGYYIYIGSARKGLSKRIERHRRQRKNIFWHIDYLRSVTEFIYALPIRSQHNLECDIAKDLEEFSKWKISGFGASDCSCSSHIFGMETNPINSARFHEILQYYRMERLMDLI